MSPTSYKPTARPALEMFRAFDPDLFANWGEAMLQALETPELDPKDEAVIIVALDSVTHPAMVEIERHVDQAFEAGACIIELIEAVAHLANLESGGHGLHDGLEALEMVIRARREAGRPTPLRGPGLAAADMRREAPWPDPPVFPYHTPKPRYHFQALSEYHPEFAAAYSAWRDAQFELRKELTRKNQEFLVTACDVAIYWPEPLIDHHMHAAFEVGATTRELLEVILLTASVAPGARRSNLAGRVIEGGVLAIHHGLTALERVLAQRESEGLLARRDRNAPMTGRPAFIGDVEQGVAAP